MKDIDIIDKRKIWLTISAVLVIIALGSILSRGLNMGIDFTGGTVMEFDFEAEVTTDEIRVILEEHDVEQTGSIQHLEDNGVLVRTEDLSQDQINGIQAQIEDEFSGVEMLRTDMVGPTIGEELRSSAIWALLIAGVAIVIYISFRFEFRFSIAALVALAHDVVIVLGVFSLFQLEIDQAMIAALLTIVGYSINDTIVISDRIREEVQFAKTRKEPLAKLANNAVVETLPRSINTSITTLLPIMAILILGGTTIQNFMFALLIGMLSGTYSSIFVASPVLVSWDKKSPMKRNF